MRILLIGSRMDAISGHSRPAYELAGSLLKAGHQVRIVSGELTGQRQALHERKLLSIFPEGAPSTERFLPGSSYAYRRDRTLRSNCAQALAWADIVHAFSFWSSAELMRAGGASRPLLLTLNTHPKASLSDFIAFGRLSIRGLARPSALRGVLASRGAIAATLKRYGWALSFTRFLAGQAIDVGFDRRRLEVWPVGLNLGQLRWHPPSRAPGPVVAYLGLLTPGRGPETLLKSFARLLHSLPEASLIVADRGAHLASDRAYLEEQRLRFLRLVQSSGLGGRVKVQGYVEDWGEFMRAVNMVVLPFRTAFGYSHPPLTVLESLAMGRPVISTHVGCLPELIDTPEKGLLVAPRDPEALAHAMEQQWRTESVHASRRRRELVLQRHDLAAATAKILDLYQRMLGADSPTD